MVNKQTRVTGRWTLALLSVSSSPSSALLLLHLVKYHIQTADKLHKLK